MRMSMSIISDFFIVTGFWYWRASITFKLFWCCGVWLCFLCTGMISSSTLRFGRIWWFEVILWLELFLNKNCIFFYSSFCSSTSYVNEPVNLISNPSFIVFSALKKRCCASSCSVGRSSGTGWSAQVRKSLRGRSSIIIRILSILPLFNTRFKNLKAC